MLHTIITVDELLAKANIIEVLNRYAQAIDRKRWEVARAAFHDDALADYGAYRGNIDGLFGYIQGRHDAIEQSMHFMGQTVVDLHGDVANAVSPAIVYQRRRADAAGSVAMFADVDAGGTERATVQIGCRYLDRLENRGDGWKIASRTIVHEWMRTVVVDETSTLGADWALASRESDDPLFGMLAQAAR